MESRYPSPGPPRPAAIAPEGSTPARGGQRSVSYESLVTILQRSRMRKLTPKVREFAPMQESSPGRADQKSYYPASRVPRIAGVASGRRLFLLTTGARGQGDSSRCERSSGRQVSGRQG